MNPASAQALQQVLMAAARDPAQRSKAVTALRGMELWAATWPMDPASLRTLTNSNGVTALAVFSSERQLEDAAARYGWLGPDGDVPSRRLHISEAMRFAKLHRAKAVVVDIAADHSFELDEGEMELVSSLPSTRPPSFAGLQAVVSRLTPREGFEVARVSSRPATAATALKSQNSEPPPSVHKPVSVKPAGPGNAVSATFAGSTTATMKALEEAPSEPLLDDFTHVLRDYPEVEWACVMRADRGRGEPAPSIALRIEPAFRKHLTEISAKLQMASAAYGQTFEVLVLDTPEQMKQARAIGVPFYPWRKEAGRKR